MTHRIQALFVLIACLLLGLCVLLGACGGSVGGVALPLDRFGERVLFEISHFGNAISAGIDPTYEVSVDFGHPSLELALGELGDGAHGLVIAADPDDPAFALLVDTLTNGTSDLIEVKSRIAVNEFGSRALDTDAFHQVPAGLPGPDLLGAQITHVRFVVHATNVVTNGATFHSIDGTFQVLGRPTGNP